MGFPTCQLSTDASGFYYGGEKSPSGSSLDDNNNAMDKMGDVLNDSSAQSGCANDWAPWMAGVEPVPTQAEADAIVETHGAADETNEVDDEDEDEDTVDGRAIAISQVAKTQRPFPRPSVVKEVNCDFLMSRPNLPKELVRLRSADFLELTDGGPVTAVATVAAVAASAPTRTSPKRPKINRIKKAFSRLRKRIDALLQKRSHVLGRSAVYLTDPEADANEQKVPFGMDILTMRDGSYIRHFARGVDTNGLAATGVEIRQNDELLMLNDVPLVNVPHDDVIRLYASLPLDRNIMTLYRRHGTMCGEDRAVASFTYFSVIARVEIQRFEDEEIQPTYLCRTLHGSRVQGDNWLYTHIAREVNLSRCDANHQYWCVDVDEDPDVVQVYNGLDAGPDYHYNFKMHYYDYTGDLIEGVSNYGIVFEFIYNEEPSRFLALENKYIQLEEINDLKHPADKFMFKLHAFDNGRHNAVQAYETCTKSDCYLMTKAKSGIDRLTISEPISDVSISDDYVTFDVDTIQ